MRTEKPWLAHYPPEVAPTSEYPKQNIAQFFLDAAQRFPDRPAIYFMGKTTTYGRLLSSVYRFSNALRTLGVKKGDRVAIMLPNCPQLVIAYLGTLLLGGVVVMTNPLYMEGELKHQLIDSGAVAIVGLDLLSTRIAKVKRDTHLQHVIITSIKDALPFPKNILYPIKAKKDGLNLDVVYGPGVHSFTGLLRIASDEPVHVEVNPDKDLAVLQYTGGTTGVAKGVMLTHSNLVANTMQTVHWFYQAEMGKERLLAALPCFHVFGLTVLLNQAMVMAGLLLLIPKFDVGLILKTIDRMKPTIFPGAPTMYIGLIHHPELKRYDLSSIKACISGSAALPVDVQDRFEELTGGRLVEGYGLTEASPVTHANNVWGKRKIGTIGIPFPDTDAKIVDSETGEELPIGEIGELVVKGPQVMQGYWNRPDDTAAALKNGWLYTGDMGSMDEDGYFTIVDRKKDLINASGFKVYPREVEEVLFEHPSVKEATVAGVPDEYRGETVKAFIVLKEGAQVSEQQLDVWCRERLAAFKVPRVYEFRDTLPKTIVGKVLRRKLMEEELAKRQDPK